MDISLALSHVSPRFMTNNGAELHIVDPAIGELVPTIGISFRAEGAGEL
jgi:hypothetical protein